MSTGKNLTEIEENEANQLRAVSELAEQFAQIHAELGGIIVGSEEAIEQTMIAILCRSHCILLGMPGLAKTLLVSIIASLMHLSFKRAQFTPDLMPADITGTDVLEEDRTTGRREFRFVKGPLFGLSSATPVAKETAVNRATVRKQRFGTLLIGTESALMELDIGGKDRFVADGDAQRIMSRRGVLIQRTNDFAEVLLNRRAVLFRR